MPLTFFALWVVVATFVAFLPIRRQYLPGGLLLVATPPLLFWIAAEHGPWVPLVTLLAVLSMFRRPLAALLGRIGVPG